MPVDVNFDPELFLTSILEVEIVPMVLLLNLKSILEAELMLLVLLLNLKLILDAALKLLALPLVLSEATMVVMMVLNIIFYLYKFLGGWARGIRDNFNGFQGLRGALVARLKTRNP